MSIRTKTVITKTIIYITSDGKEFPDDDSAQEHEDELKQSQKEDACAPFRKIRHVDDFGGLLNKLFRHSRSDKPVQIYTFHITNEQELRLFCDAYKYWDSYLCKFDRLKDLPYPQSYVLFDGIGEYGYYFAKKNEIQQAVDMLTAFTKICDE